MFAHDRRRLTRFGRLLPRNGKYERKEEEEEVQPAPPSPPKVVESAKEPPPTPITLPPLFPVASLPSSFSRSCDCWDYVVSGECWCPDYIC